MSFDDEKPHTVEKRVEKVGRIIEVEITSSPLFGPDGSVIAVIESVRDIAGRKRTEEALIERSRHLSLGSEIGMILTKDFTTAEMLQRCTDSLVRHLDILFARIWIIDDSGTMLELQASSGRYTHKDGLHSRIPVGKFKIGTIASEGMPHFTNTVKDDSLITDQDWVRREKIASFAGYPLIIENMVIGVMAMFSLKPFSEETFEKLGSIASEIALGIKRKQAERDLSNQMEMVSNAQQEWMLTFDAIKDIIYIIDNDSTIIRANKAFSEFVGRAPDEVIGMKCYDVFDNSLHHDTCCPISLCGDNGKAFSAELNDQKSNRLFSLSAYPFINSSGKTIGVISVAKDITDDRNREMKLIMSERLAALGEMGASLAHEINNPLASISGCAESLLRRINDNNIDAGIFSRYLGIIESEVSRCNNITRSMLSFVRRESILLNELNVNELIEKALELLTMQERMQNVSARKNFDIDIPKVRCNEEDLRQVLMIVLSNSLDAMNDSGTIFIETSSIDGKIAINVSDTGPGLPDSTINKVFEPFYTTKAASGGTGLGLAIAKKLLNNNNGSIEAISAPGKGAKFRILIPAAL